MQDVDADVAVEVAGERVELALQAAVGMLALGARRRGDAGEGEE